MFSIFRSAPATKPRLTPAEAIERARAGALTLVDVREAAEIAQTGRAEGALHVPLALVALKCDPNSPDCIGLPVSGAIGVYCASGGRSGLAAAALERLGYTEVHNLGGLNDLAAAGARIAR